MKFSPEFEAQADYLGIQYLWKTAYDPESFVAFFEKIEDMEKHKPGIISKMFEDHPPTPDRIANAQREISRILSPLCQSSRFPRRRRPLKPKARPLSILFRAHGNTSN